MAAKNRYDSIISTLGALAMATALFGLLALFGAWLLGSPAQAEASPLDPTPTAALPSPTDEVTVSVPALKTPAPTRLPSTPVESTPAEPTPLPPAEIPTTEVPATAAPAMVAADADGVNVRCGPGTDFAKVGTLSPGAEATVSGRFGDWWRIEVADGPAWVASWVVTARNVEDVPEVAAPPAPEGAGLTITTQADGSTLLVGPVRDQAALHGLLNKIRDMGLPLLSVERR